MRSLSPLLVCGNANVETVFHPPAGGLPAEGGFHPHALTLNVSGVGVNLARALHVLGSPVRFLTLAGDDLAAQVIRHDLEASGIYAHFARTTATPQSLAVIQGPSRHAFYRDLKDTPQQAAPVAEFQTLLPGSAAALITNIGWTRELLPLARAAQVPVLTDVQDIAHLHHPHDQAYFQAADVLIFSAERLTNPADTLRQLLRRTRTRARILIATLGAGGAFLMERHSHEANESGDPGDLHHQPALPMQAAFHGGAGDALAGAFAHYHYTRQWNARQALQHACMAAALKLRTAASGLGHATESDVQNALEHLNKATHTYCVQFSRIAGKRCNPTASPAARIFCHSLRSG